MLKRLAFANIKNRKRNFIISTVILVLAFLIFLSTNNVTVALRNYTEGFREAPQFRILTVDSGTKGQELVSQIEAMPHVEAVEEVYLLYAMHINEEPFGIVEEGREPYFQLHLKGCYSFYDLPILQGRPPENPGEIVLPQYFQPDVSKLGWSGFGKEPYNFLNGADFIGKQMTCGYTMLTGPDDDDWEEREITLTVVGIFDAVNQQDLANTAYINRETLKAIVEESKKNAGTDEYRTYYTLVDEYQYVDEVLHVLEQQPSIDAYQYAMVSEDLIQVIGIMELLTTVLSAAALIVAFICIYFLISLSMKKNARYIAILKTMGYQNKQLLRLSLTENLILSGFSFVIIAILSFLLFIVFWHSLTSAFLSIYWADMSISVSNYLVTLLVTLGLSVLIPLLCVLLSYWKIDKISPVKILREE